MVKYIHIIKRTANETFRKINTEGERIVTPKVILLHCILDEEWDNITFQQASGLSSIPDTYFPYLSNLLEYVSRNAAACAWFETLTGKSVVGNNFFPETITYEEARVIQLSAHYVVKKPNTTKSIQ